MKSVKSYEEVMALIDKLKPGEALQFRVEQPWGLTLYVTRRLRKAKAKHGFSIYPEVEEGRVTITRKPKPRVLKLDLAKGKKEGEK